MSSGDLILIVVDLIFSLVVVTLSFITFRSESYTERSRTVATAGMAIITGITIAIIIGGIVSLVNPGLSRSLLRLITTADGIMIPLYFLTVRTSSRDIRIVMGIVTAALGVSFIAELVLISTAH